MKSGRTYAALLIPLGWAFGMTLARFAIAWEVIGLTSLILAAGVFITRERSESSASRGGRWAMASVAAPLMVAGTYLIFPVLARLWPGVAVSTGNLYRRFLSGHPKALSVCFVLVVVVCEEWIWRGAFQEWVAARHLPLWVTVMLSATIYAFAHAPLGSALLVGVAFICGLYWSSLRAISGSLIPSLGSHLLWDLSLILFPLAPLHGSM